MTGVQTCALPILKNMGRQEGFQAGRSEGRSEGRLEGRSEGRSEERINAGGFPFETRFPANKDFRQFIRVGTVFIILDDL